MKRIVDIVTQMKRVDHIDLLLSQLRCVHEPVSHWI
jgi:hypothetical protein